MADLTATVTAANGVRFTARLLRKGDKYGRDGALTWEDYRPAVEFYDTRHPHTRFGQFTGGRYYVETILDVLNYSTGLMLATDVAAWTIDGPAMRIIRLWLEQETGRLR